MLCAIYKSKKKEGMYLYIAKRDDFSALPNALREAFGTPAFVMLFNLAGQKTLINADNQEVMKNKLDKTVFICKCRRKTIGYLPLINNDVSKKIILKSTERCFFWLRENLTL